SLMRDSLAATFALVTPLQYAGYFNQIIIQSPLIDYTSSSFIKSSAKQHLSIYHSRGLNETAVYTTEKEEVDFVQPNKVISKYLKENFSDYTFAEIPAGNHTWKYWQEELPEVLEDMFG